MMKRVWLSAVLVGYAWLAASTLVGEHGLLHLWTLQQEQRELQAEAFALLSGNENLRNRLSRLQTDDEFFEKIARETLKFARKGELLYLFQKAPEASTP
ncbi:MAG: septum formation initiator family protein [Deltaproteobacteria bacterium]|nr:septum formation initiator family protein [Deltaproteobacteria bacterium]